MTDVRDPEPRVEVEAKEAGDVRPAPRQTIVSRALAPIRRVTGLDPAPQSHREIALRAEAPEPMLETKTGFGIIRWSFLLAVVLPTLVFGLYVFFISSDQYVSEARFAVRPVDGIGGNEMSLVSLGAGDAKDKSAAGGTSPSAGGASYLTGTPNLGGEDAEIVANYIHSRAIVDDVSHSVDIRAIFQRPEADFYARLETNASAEDILDYWKKMVSVYIETSSGIVTLSVSAFRREDALVLTKAILKSSETLVNSLSRKVRADAMKTAEEEVRRADGEVRFALADLTSFRNSHKLIDPIQSSETTGKLLMQLLSDKIETEGALYVAERTQGTNAPGVNTIRAKLDSINQHVGELQDQMAGKKQVSRNLAATLAEFESLELKEKFAERMYGFARDGVERARVAAIRQTVYLAVFVPPSLPQEFSYPLRYTDFSLFAAAFLIFWICGVTVTASILDHRL